MVLEGEIERDAANLTLLLVEGREAAAADYDYDASLAFLPNDTAAAATVNASLVAAAADGGELPLSDLEDMDCSECLNELCLSEEDYAMYKSWVGVDTYEMVLICINVIVFLTGIVGNSLVRNTYMLFTYRYFVLPFPVSVIILSSNVQLFLIGGRAKWGRQELDIAEAAEQQAKGGEVARLCLMASECLAASSVIRERRVDAR